MQLANCNKFRIDVAVEESEPVAEAQSTPGETKVSRLGGNTPGRLHFVPRHD
jgi:hypothetical protein